MTNKINKTVRGFTLIELLVTIAIIAVLSAVLIANMVGIRERAADTKTKNDLNQLKSALRLYYNDNQSYKMGVNNWTSCSSALGEPFKSATGVVYMKKLPAADCEYRSGSATDTNDTENFIVRATLKNIGDQDITASAANCNLILPSVSGYHYYVCPGN